MAGPTLSDEQRQAIIAAQLEHRMTSVAVSEAAKDGTLPGAGESLEPFRVSASTARGLKAKRAPAVNTDEEPDAAALIVARLEVLLEREVAALEKADAPDLQRAREAARLAVELGKAKRAGRPVRRAPLGGAVTPGDEADFLEQLAAMTS